MNRQSGWEILKQYSRKIEERRTRRARRPKLDLLHACRQGNISRYISKVGPDCGPRRGRVDAVKDEALGEATSNKAFGPGTGAVERGVLGRGCASSAWLDDGESRTQTRTPSNVAATDSYGSGVGGDLVGPVQERGRGDAISGGEREVAIYGIGDLGDPTCGTCRRQVPRRHARAGALVAASERHGDSHELHLRLARHALRLAHRDIAGQLLESSAGLHVTCDATR